MNDRKKGRVILYLSDLDLLATERGKRNVYRNILRSNQLNQNIAAYLLPCRPF